MTISFVTNTLRHSTTEHTITLNPKKKFTKKFVKSLPLYQLNGLIRLVVNGQIK